MYKYEAIEDNAGALHLAVFNPDGTVRYLHCGYELHADDTDIQRDIAALKGGDDPLTWDGAEAEPQWQYEEMAADTQAYKTVADSNGIYPDVMGIAARRAFGIKA